MLTPNHIENCFKHIRTYIYQGTELTIDIFLSEMSGLDSPCSPSHLKVPGDPGNDTARVSHSWFSGTPFARLFQYNSSFCKSYEERS